MGRERYELKGYTQYSVGLGEPWYYKYDLFEKGLLGLAITDVNTATGWIDEANFTDESFRFFYGVDVQLQNQFDYGLSYKNNEDGYAARVTLLVKNRIGKRNLMDLLFEASSVGKEISAYPIIETSALKKYREGILIGYSCDNNILTEEEPDVEKELKESPLTRMIDLVDYVEIAPSDYNPLFPYVDLRKRKYVQAYTKRLVEYAENHNKLVIAVSGFHYLDEDNNLTWRVLQCDGDVSATEGHHISEYGMVAHLRTTDELLEEFQYLGFDEAEKIVIDNTISIAEMIDIFDPTFVPDCHIRWNDAEELLRSHINDGIHKKYDSTMTEVARKRVEKELTWIFENGYTELLLMFAETVDKHSNREWDHSACEDLENSVVAFILGISSIDPIKNGLPFEFLVKAANNEYFALGISVPQSQRETIISSLGKMRGVCSTINATKPMYYYDEEVHEMVYEYERISGKRLFWEEKSHIETALTGMEESSRYNDIPYYLLPESEENIIDRRWNGNSLVSDFLGNSLIQKEFTSFILDSNEVIDVLLNLEQLTGKSVSSIEFSDSSPMTAFESDSISYAPRWTAGIYWEKYNEPILRFGIHSFKDMVFIEGLCRGKGTWDRIQSDMLDRCEMERNDLITNREDVYELLVSRGMDATGSFRITCKICNGSGIDEEDTGLMKSYNITEKELYILKHIIYMPGRAECIRMARIRFWLAYYKVNYPSQFYKAYLDCIADSREWDVIKAGPEVLKSVLSLIGDYDKPSSYDQPSFSNLEIYTRALTLADEMFRRDIRV
ncbi:PHP domain-containing protein [Oribacterium sp. FC2011]|uniref:PHP domain-containing protein n=1 Tax=Oribacterium sp. FC2011 TaxID=1408311 RepID=UPI0004E15685|nr:PHP domain-containing protein [Oribacterium sp. FC2011]